MLVRNLLTACSTVLPRVCRTPTLTSSVATINCLTPTINNRATFIQRANMSSDQVNPYSRAGLYELRTYPMVPSKANEFLQLVKEHFHLRTSHSEMLGFWTAEIGALNQVVHLWYYDSLEHRKSVRAALAQDKDWISLFFSKITVMLQSQENALLEAIPHMPVSNDTSTKPSIYELHTVDMSVPSHEWSTPLIEFATALSGSSSGSEEEKPCLVGAWQTNIGRLNQAVMIWKYPSMDAAIQSKKNTQKQQDVLYKMSSDWKVKLLLPNPKSPLQ